MIDAITTLAFSIFSNKGVYALLLGSGISRDTGIPTGWEITLDLINKLSVTQGEFIRESDLAEWYREKHKQEPNYSDIIEKLAKTEIERQKLLCGYFEPTEEEKEEGKKTPTKAHHAIAKLISKGYIQVVVTTNFDRLLEQALGNLGITCNVLSTAEQMEGGTPLRHSGATLLKIHGDYRYHKLKNTEDELSNYEVPINKMLDQVFDEYGLIVCGWSSDYDHALRKAIERTPNKRYSMYWTHLSDPKGKALELIKHRDAVSVKIAGADDFFEGLAEKIQSLENINACHPMSEKIAIATVKRYLLDPHAQIKLHELIKLETDRVVEEIQREEFTANTIQRGVLPYSREEKFPQYETICNRLLKLLCIMSYWGGERHHVDLIVNTLQRISFAKPETYDQYYSKVVDSQLCPVLLLFYAVGITRLATGKYDFFTRFASFNYCDHEYKEIPFIASMLPDRVLALVNLSQRAPEANSDPIRFIFCVLREPLRTFIPDDTMYKTCAERFEYYKWITILYEAGRNKDCQWIVDNKFPWRFFAGIHYERKIQHLEPLSERIKKEIERGGANWEALKDGICGGDKIIEFINFIIEGELRYMRDRPTDFWGIVK